MSSSNKAVVRDFFDAVRRHDLAAMRACYADDAHVRDLPDDVPPTPDGLIEVLRRSFFTGFPNADLSMDHVVAEDDLVALHWSWEGKHEGSFGGVPATGKHVGRSRMSLFRVREGKIVEHWAPGGVTGLIQELRAAHEEE